MYYMHCNEVGKLVNTINGNKSGAHTISMLQSVPSLIFKMPAIIPCEETQGRHFLYPRLVHTTEQKTELNKI